MMLLRMIGLLFVPGSTTPTIIIMVFLAAFPLRLRFRGGAHAQEHSGAQAPLTLLRVHHVLLARHEELAASFACDFKPVHLRLVEREHGGQHDLAPKLLEENVG